MKSEIVESFSQMVKDKKIDRDLLESIIKEVFGMMIKKKYGQNASMFPKQLLKLLLTRKLK
jgi:transcription termination/antitermination protein NusA